MNPTRIRLRYAAPLLLCLTAGTCSIPVNQTLVTDGQLVVTTLETIDNIAASIPGVPASVTGLVGLALTGIQDGLTALQSGAKTPVAVATLIQTEIQTVAQPLATDLKANATIQNGLALLSNLAPVLAADAGTAAPAPLPTAAMVSGVDPRAALQNWVKAPK